jgi:hypothetical protein
MDIPQWITDRISAEWSTVTGHWQLAFALAGLGFFLGCWLTWLYFRQQLNVRADRIEHLRAQIDARPQTGDGRGVLSVSGPNVFRDPKYSSQNRWRMKVNNSGSAAAENVQMRLKAATPAPKDHRWGSDFPYPIAAVGYTLDSTPRQINPGDHQDYEVLMGWKTESGQFFTLLDTKAGGGQIQIQLGENWDLTYELTAKNAGSAQFVLRAFVEQDQVMMIRVS